MLSRSKCHRALEKELSEETFHALARHWRPVSDPLREAEKAERDQADHDHLRERKPRRRSFWSPWLWIK